MVTHDERTALFLAHHGCLAIPASAGAIYSPAEVHRTPAGQWVDLGDPFGGILALAEGHAVLELAARPTSAPGEIPPDVAEVLKGLTPDRDNRFGNPNARRTRFGVGEALRMRPKLFDARARAAWPKLSVFALSPLVWIVQPESQEITRDQPESLASIHDDFSRFLGRGVQPFLSAFPKGAALSFDAARLVASFGQVVRLARGETLVEVGADTHAGVVMSGCLAMATAVLKPGDVFHTDRFGPGPFVAAPATTAVIAQQESVVALFRHEMLTALTAFDPRRAIAAPPAPTRILHAVVGDADEARPDGQTMALQTAATIAKEMAVPGLPSGVLYVDLDGVRFRNRLPAALATALPIVSDLSRIRAFPDLQPWSSLGLPLALVGVDGAALSNDAAVRRLVELCLPDSPGAYAHVVLRIPRALSARLGPAFERAYSVSFSSDHLLDPVPPGVPSTCDLVHLRRFGRHENSILVEEIVESRFERGEHPTSSFWKSGVPWCLATEGSRP